MNWPRAIIHLDMDAFYVSVERKSDPALVGKPVIVGGGPGGEIRRGVVAACSYEARVFGIHSAMPLTRAMRLCPDAVLVPVGRSKYSVETARIRAILEEFNDLVEMTSPDEAYLDLQGTEMLHGPPIEVAARLRRRIVSRLDLPASVGLATSKTVAKIASKLAKPNGLFVVFPGHEAAILSPLPVRALPGLGPKTGERLKSNGIETLGDIARRGEAGLKALLGNHGASLFRRALGDCTSQVRSSRDPVQLSTEETFAEDIGDEARLGAALARMTMKLGRRLRRRGQWAGTLTLKLRYPDFTTLTRQTPLSPPSDDDTILLRAARALLKDAWDHRTPLRLIGVGTARLTAVIQEDLFPSEADRKHRRLLETMDSIRQRGGEDQVRWASAMDPVR
ncbi:DNA polymerase IV [Candidatus Sumerlaeota bacterium]|nr:DNA polymerase IV [Candidatus Sumerlaeota bacterium]